MKKVLLVSCDGLGNGGVQSVMMGIVRTLSNEFRFDILLFTDEVRFYDNEFERYGGKIYRLPPPKSRFLKKMNNIIGDFLRYNKVLKILKEQHYDVIHCNKELESALILRAAYKCNIPIRICHSHIVNTLGYKILGPIFLLRKYLIEKYSTTKVACSKLSAENIYLNNDRTYIINNFYDGKKFYTSKDSLNDKSELTLSQLGSYSPNKNQMFSIDIVCELKKKHPNVMLYLIGFSSLGYDKILLKYISAKNLENNIKFVDGNKDFVHYLQTSSYFLFPSYEEGFGTSLIEAQAVGLRCYASDTVPSSTNCGGVVYLPLSKGAVFWAQEIESDYKINKGSHVIYDTSQYSLENIMEKYRRIYTNG